MSRYIERPDGSLDIAPGYEALQQTFGLSYAKWVVMPRSVMEAMPDDWQMRASLLIDELFEAFPALDKDGDFVVTLHDRSTGRVMRLPSALCEYRPPDRDALVQYRSRSTP